MFDTLIPFQYSEQDRRAGYFFGKDRRGQLHRVPLMTVSIGVVTNERRRFTHAAQVSALATEMKSYAKTLPGSVYSIDRRTDAPPPPEMARIGESRRVDVRQGGRSERFLSGVSVRFSRRSGKVPAGGIRARCSVCGGVITVGVGGVDRRGVRTDAESTAPVRAPRAVSAPSVVPRRHQRPTTHRRFHSTRCNRRRQRRYRAALRSRSAGRSIGVDCGASSAASAARPNGERVDRRPSTAGAAGAATARNSADAAGDGPGHSGAPADASACDADVHGRAAVDLPPRSAAPTPGASASPLLTGTPPRLTGVPPRAAAPPSAPGRPTNPSAPAMTPPPRGQRRRVVRQAPRRCRRVATTPAPRAAAPNAAPSAAAPTVVASIRAGADPRADQSVPRQRSEREGATPVACARSPIW